MTPISRVLGKCLRESLIGQCLLCHRRCGKSEGLEWAFFAFKVQDFWLEGEWSH